MVPKIYRDLSALVSGKGENLRSGSGNKLLLSFAIAT